MNLNRLLQQQRPLIMGILNLTPDSFSDGGSHTDRGRAVRFALQMVSDGADIIDVGGESTRPGAQRISAEEQIDRVADVIRALRRTLPESVPISIDTTLSEVAEQAVDAGASIVNDVRAGRDDARMFSFAAERALPVIIMHMQGTPENMQQDPHYHDVVGEISAFLRERCDAAMAAGVPKEQIVIDPGIGFGKLMEHNLEIMGALARFTELGFPVLLGASRKRFMGTICGESVPAHLVGATCAATALGVAAGIRIFRVHDVKPNRQAADISWAVFNPKESAERRV